MEATLKNPMGKSLPLCTLETEGNREKGMGKIFVHTGRAGWETKMRAENWQVLG